VGTGLASWEGGGTKRGVKIGGARGRGKESKATR
jgi:hypothetical protein